MSAIVGFSIYQDYKSTVAYPNYQHYEINFLVRRFGKKGFLGNPLIYVVIILAVWFANWSDPTSQQGGILFIMGGMALAHGAHSVRNRILGYRLNKALK